MGIKGKRKRRRLNQSSDGTNDRHCRVRRNTPSQPNPSPPKKVYKISRPDSATSNHAICVFQDVLARRRERKGREAVGGERALGISDDESENDAIFELANAPIVGLRVGRGDSDAGVGVEGDLHTTNSQKGRVVVAVQDPTIEKSSSGIVWETCFALGLFLEACGFRMLGLDPTGAGVEGRGVRVCEVGAGVGLLGAALWAMGCHVLVTDVPDAMQTLSDNVQRNIERLGGRGAGQGGTGGSKRQLEALPLTWGRKRDVKAAKAWAGSGGFDLVVATDVVFSERLVPPLIDSLWRLCGEQTKVVVCVQVRDPAAHAAFLKTLPDRFAVSELDLGVGGEVLDFALKLECLCLLLRPLNMQKKVAGT